MPKRILLPATITGLYAYSFTVEGESLAGPPGMPIGPMKGVAMTTFSADGKLTQIDTVTVNGQVVADFTHPLVSRQLHGQS